MGAVSPMLCVRDMKESIEFYQRVLGFTLGMVFPDIEHAEYADLQKDGMSVMLAPARSDGINSRAKLGTGVYIYMQIDGDVDEYYSQLKERGVMMPFDIKDEPYGIRDFTVQDNSGYKLVFNQVSKKAKVCLSCGMPMTTAEDFGGGNRENLYCVHCTMPDGSLKSREEVFQGMASFMMGSRQLDRKGAEQAAREYMSKMPAWGGPIERPENAKTR
jgi:uncharacterized glyoxalase superfamily protein PhnB